MTTFAGFTPKRAFRCELGIRSSNLDSMTTNQQLFKTWLTTRTRANTRTSHLPLATSHRTGLVGIKLDFLLSTIYGRVHILPANLALGNIIGIQQRDVAVWNANFFGVTLQSIAKTDAEGVDITGQSSPPLYYGPLQERAYQVQVTGEGPANLDAQLVWTFSDGEVRTLGITGSRLVVFSFYPTWEGGITESLDWLTDVIASPLGDEQRRSLRLAPRRAFEIDIVAEGRERQRMDLYSFNWGASIWVVPVWNDVQTLYTAPRAGDVTLACQTDGRDFVKGGLILLRGDDEITYEVAEVSDILPTGLAFARPLQMNWPKYTILYPLRTARFTEQPTITRLTDTAVTAKYKFSLVENSDVTPWVPTEMHQGYPVFRLPFEESESLTNSYIRLLRTLDTKTNQPAVYDTAGLGFTVQSYRWLLNGRAEQTAFRRFLYFLRGQWKSVFVPTHSNDMTMVLDYSKTVQTIDIEHIEYTKFGQRRPARKDLLITLIDGQTFMRRITGSSEISSSVERITLDSTLGIDIPVSRVARISYMALSRLASDSVEIDHQTDSDGVAACRVTWRSLRDDIA